MLTIAGWNKSMFPPDKQPLIEKDLIDAFVPREGNAEDVGVAVQIMDLVLERRQRLIPDLRGLSEILCQLSEFGNSSDILNLNRRRVAWMLLYDHERNS